MHLFGSPPFRYSTLVICCQQVVIQYKAFGRPLHDAHRVWAHIGHSGWQSTEDLELFRSPGEYHCWTGIYKLPACRLATPLHAEVQMVFMGQMPEGHVQWDNNDGNNWQVWYCLHKSYVSEHMHQFFFCFPHNLKRDTICIRRECGYTIRNMRKLVLTRAPRLNLLQLC